jgi:hypothetical protein
MKFSRYLLIIVGLLLAVIIGTLVWSSSVCQQLNSGPPTAPIYPGATLITKDVTLGNYPHAAEYYTSADSPDRVIAFYEAHAVCYKISQGTACTANASPLGKYTVHISEQSYQSRQVTAFDIWLDWDSCTGEWFK